MGLYCGHIYEPSMNCLLKIYIFVPPPLEGCLCPIVEYNGTNRALASIRNMKVL